VVKLASITDLLEAPRRKRDRDEPRSTPDPMQLSALDGTTLKLLRQLAARSLEMLGIREVDKFIEAEMVSKFNSLAGGVPSGVDGEIRLRDAIVSALEQLDEQ
jgi:hypothetical protein